LRAATLPPGPAADPNLSASALLDFERNGHVATRGLLAPAEFAGVAKRLRAIAEAERAEAEEHAEEFAGAGLLDVWDGAERGGALAPAADAEEEGDLEDEASGHYGSPSGAPPFLQVFNPHRRHAAARDLAFSPALAATAAALLGVACVRLYQDCLFWKRPGHDATSWHADLWTAPLATNAAVTVWLPLHNVGVADAPLFFQSRSHRDMAALVHSGQMEELGIDQDACPPPGMSGVHHAPLQEGDATWHHGWTVHGAPPLDPDAATGVDGRLAYAATYFADGARALLAAAEPEDGPSFVDWLPEVEPGSLASHELLPVAYPRP